MTAVATRSLGAALFLGLIGGGAGAHARPVEMESPAAISVPNKLTPDEEVKGWKLLFNGKDLSGWRVRDSATAPAGWVIRDTALAYAGKGPTSILSTEAYGDFELTLEWKVGIAGDAGLYLRVWNEKVVPSRSAPEVQLVDNFWNTSAMEPKQSAGACMHLYPPSADMTRPVGQWNRLRVVAVGKKVEHWLNDSKVVEYEIGSEDWKSRLARSPLKSYQDLGAEPRGFLGLQQTGITTRLRNIKIRPLGMAMGVIARQRPADQARAAWATGLWIDPVRPASGLRDARGRHVSGPFLAAHPAKRK